jgi:putative protease
MKSKIEKQSNKIPELLLPAGSPEAFLAALEGGADAVYLGLQQFNARGRAKNFHIAQLPALIHKAKEYNAKVYITLNTLIKNKELPYVIDSLQEISRAFPAAIIIQDWGVYQLCKQHFPKLKLHASTQMGNHNSLDCTYSGKAGFERVILARELTLTELAQIAQTSKVQLEVFAHGALCYSLSGSCLYSSWAGGMSANRGQCRQPCRHLHEQNGVAEHFFSMKDLQLIEFVPQLIELGISALKIEGRMRSADYVYQVASAYRLALDHPDQIAQAKEMLINDGGRDKTTWYFTGTSSFATTGNTFTGKGIGKVLSHDKQGMIILLMDNLTQGSYIRFQNETDQDSEAIQITKLQLISETGNKTVTSASAGDKVLLDITDRQIPIGSIVYQTKHSTHKRWYWKPTQTNLKSSDKNFTRQVIADIQKSISSKIATKQPRLYFRISDTSWLALLEKYNPWEIIIPSRINLGTECNRKHAIELPYFVAEDSLSELKEQITQHIERGHRTFYLSRLSQRELFIGIKDVRLKSTEQVYALNDAVLCLLKEKGITEWILPLENDYPNLLESSNRDGIVPLYYHPPLFYSRQSVLSQDGKLKHGKDLLLYKQAGGMTKLIPEKAVCNFNFIPKLTAKGYHKFLIDLSEHKPDQDFLAELMSHFLSATNLKDTSRFNLKQGLW